MNLLLQRKVSDAQCTEGDLYILKDPPGDRMWECHTLEDVVREIPGKPVSEWKIWGETAIPQGRYRLVLAKPRRPLWSPREDGHLLMLLDVPGYTGIYVHALNRPEQTAGCIGVGQSRRVGMVLRSRAALEALMGKIVPAIADEEVWLEIRNATEELKLKDDI